MGTQDFTRELTVRDASRADIPDIAAILTEAFPSLYQATFGKLPSEVLTLLLADLYSHELISLRHTRLAVRNGDVLGVMVLNSRGAIGEGRVSVFLRVLFRRLRFFPALRAAFGGLAATVMLSSRIPAAPHLLYIEELAVKEGARGQGIGGLLLQDAEVQALAQGRPLLTLHVLRRNIGARRLYERCGFRPWKPNAAVSDAAASPVAALPSRPLHRLRPEKREWYAILMRKDLQAGP